MMERQIICDCFDSDPLNFFEDDEDKLLRMQVDRLLVRTKEFFTVCMLLQVHDLIDSFSS